MSTRSKSPRVRCDCVRSRGGPRPPQAPAHHGDREKCHVDVTVGEHGADLARQEQVRRRAFDVSERRKPQDEGAEPAFLQPGLPKVGLG